jgi:C4-dicarboxylate transporter DctM subunit
MLNKSENNIMDVVIAFALIVLLFAVLGSGLWIGLSLLAVALIGMELFTSGRWATA